MVWKDSDVHAKASVIAAAAVLCWTVPGAAATVSGWRTDGTGVYPKASPVTEWAKDKNVVWHTGLPSWSK